MITKKQIELMLLIIEKDGLTYKDKICRKIYTHPNSVARVLDDLCKKGFCVKKENLLGENIYLLTPKGNNLLVVLGYMSYIHMILP